MTTQVQNLTAAENNIMAADIPSTISNLSTAIGLESDRYGCSGAGQFAGAEHSEAAAVKAA